MDYGETCFITVGHLDGRMVVTVCTPRAGARRIISMRKANEREQDVYDPRWLDPDNAPDLSTSEWRALIDAAPVTRGRPRTNRPKISTTIRLDADVLDHFRTGGPGWQSRRNAALRTGMGRGFASRGAGVAHLADVGPGLDEEDLTAICPSERVPLWPTLRPEFCESGLELWKTQLLKKIAISIFGEIIRSQRRQPMEAADGMEPRMACCKLTQCSSIARCIHLRLPLQPSGCGTRDI